MHGTAQLHSVAYGASWIISLAVGVAFFVVAITVVRRASPRASLLMSLGIATSLALGCATPLVSAGLARFAEGGPDGFARAQSLMSVTNALLAAAGHVLVIVGVVALARPPRRDPRDPDVS